MGERSQRSEAIPAIAGVAAELPAVARLAATGTEEGKLLAAVVDALRASFDFSDAVYLAHENGRLRRQWAVPTRTAGGDGPDALEVDDHPALTGTFAGRAAIGLAAPGLAELRDALTALAGRAKGKRRGLQATLLLPVVRGEDREGVLVLFSDEGVRPSATTLEIATVYAALLGLGIAAVHRADRLEQLRRALQERNDLLVEEISGEADACRALESLPSRPMRRLVQMAKQVSVTDAPVLITGETGAGKEVLARAIHEWSDRSDGPFVQLNCAALPDNLIESELFGHVRGAFTGAVDDRSGRFRVADGGTLLLDEIGEMPMEAQAKLLRVLEAGVVTPVGGDRRIQVDVRVIAATNVDLELAIDRGQFREDLYFRLHVFPLHVPPLRERVDDLPALVEQIVARIERRTGHGPWRVSDADIERLRAYPWPGNVRELLNAVERARVFSPLGGTLTIEVGDEGRARPTRSRRRRRWTTLDQHQKAYIEEVLRHTGGKIYGSGGAAELLGLPPSTLQSRMKKLGVERPAET